MIMNPDSIDFEMQFMREANNLVVESLIADNLSNEEISEMTESSEVCNDLVSMGIVTEKTIVRLDKKAKISRAYKTAVFTIAREKKDPKFKKLVTVWRMERALEAYLMKKYHAEAMKRAKVAVAKLNSTRKDTKGRVIAKAVSKAKKQFNPLASK